MCNGCSPTYDKDSFTPPCLFQVFKNFKNYRIFSASVRGVMKINNLYQKDANNIFLYFGGGGGGGA